jgi:hypothetical protein
MAITSFIVHSFRAALPHPYGTKTRINRAGRYELLAFLFSYSTLIIALVAAVPYDSYDFPPQVLFDDFLPQTEIWDYNPRIERGSWLILEVTSDVLVEIYAQQQGSGGIYMIGSWTAYRKTITLSQARFGEVFLVSVKPLQDGNVTVSIVDSSMSATNSIHVVLASPWFLFLFFLAIATDAFVIFRWSRARCTMRGTRQEIIDGKEFEADLEVSRIYLAISWIRKLKSQLSKKREKSDAS